MSKTPAFVFPGQGSQAVGMLADLASVYPEIRVTFEQASDVLEMDLWRLSQQGPEEELNATANTQPSLLAAGVGVWRVWQAQGGRVPVILAGHSLGEYSALVAAGALDFSAALRLVRRRGELMQDAVAAGSGAMAAILGLDDDAVRSVCAEAGQGEIVEAANFNSPGQVVISGQTTAVERAVAMAKAAGAKRAMLLSVSVPSHCSLMKPAAEQLMEVLGALEIGQTQIPVVHNVDVSLAADANAVRDRLAQQLFQPVRWVENVQRIKSQGAELLIETGPGKVLTGLTKRIDRELESVSITDPAGFDKALEMTNA